MEVAIGSSCGAVHLAGSIAVQLGSELTVPARLVHVPHAEPLNSLTMIADLLLRTAHATCPVETSAQEGLPKPVTLPVEMKLPQDPHANGPNPSRLKKLILAIRSIILDFMWSPFWFALTKSDWAFFVSLK
jgi:hypothetical protein